MRYKLNFLLLLVVALLGGCEKSGDEEVKTPSELQMNAEVVLPQRGGDFYASWLYLASGLAQVYDNPLFNEEVVELTMRNPGEGTCIALRMLESDVADVAYREVIAGNEEIVSLRFPVIWKLEVLRNRKSEAPVTLSWQVTLNGQLAGTYEKSFICRPAEECVVKVESGQTLLGAKAMQVGYVDENNPLLETLIREALDLGTVPSFTDYQRGKEYVRQQLLAIWNVLENRGLRVLDEEKSGWVQKLRPMGQVLASRAGSEEEIALLMASFCLKIGFCTVLEAHPDGMYLAIADGLYSMRPKLIYFVDVSKLAGTLEGSRTRFSEALLSGAQKYEAQKEARQTNPLQYEELWIDPIRLYVPSLSITIN